jgi:hypothetical protein
LILTLGYFFWKSAATDLSVGSQAQTVTEPPFLRAAWMSSAETGFWPELSSSEPPQAVAPRARTERTARPRIRRRVVLRMEVLPLLRGWDRVRVRR